MTGRFHAERENETHMLDGHCYGLLHLFYTGKLKLRALGDDYVLVLCSLDWTNSNASSIPLNASPMAREASSVGLRISACIVHVPW
jgi:hypothetical protein